MFDEPPRITLGAFAFERGEAIDLCVTELPSAPRKIRRRNDLGNPAVA